MKSARFVTIALLVLVAISASLNAQERSLAQATIPFAFTVENVNLPAGTYIISTLPPYQMIRVQSAAGNHFALVQAMSDEGVSRSNDTKLVFNHIGDHYFLAQVWEQGSAAHRQLREGKLARELVASGQSVSGTTVIAGAGK